MGQLVPAGERLLVEGARKALYELVGAAEAGRVTRIGRGSVTALLAPLDFLGEEHRAVLPDLPSLPVTEARKTLGTLVTAAAAGQPQVLCRRRSPVAVLIPETAGQADDAPTSVPPAPAGPLPPARERELASLGEVLGDVLGPSAQESGDGAAFGLKELDEACGGLLPGRLVLVAAEPGAGGSLLAVAAARTTALVLGRSVLYAASGLSRSDVAGRVMAAEAGADYRRLRAGALTGPERAAVAEVTERLSRAVLHIDDGTDLTAQAIAETVPHVQDVALVVVDRLQHVPDPQVPLSGPALPAAVRTLVHVARTSCVPVLAVVDTDDRDVVRALDADVTLTLTRHDDRARVLVTERDFGALATVALRAEMACARFTDADDPRLAVFDAYPPSEATATVTGGPVPLRQPQPARRPLRRPPEELAAPVPSALAASRRRTAERPDLAAFIPERVAHALELYDGDIEAARTYLAGAPNKAGQSLEDVMELWDMTRVGGRYDHTAYPQMPPPLVRRRKGNADEVWEGRPKFTHPGQELHGRGVTRLDVNGAYLSALSTAMLPVRSVTHNPVGRDVKGRAWSWDNPDDYARGAKLSGIVLIDQLTWPHRELPHPLGDDRETAGQLWVPTSVFAKLRDAVAAGLLEQVPRIREAYVAPGTEVMFKVLVDILREARAKAIACQDDLTKAYVAKMYAVLVATCGDSQANHHLHRPDWEHIIRGQAFASLWRKAIKAHRAGLVVAYAGGTDELHLVGDVFGACLDGQSAFRQGTGLNEIKVKGSPYGWTGRPVQN